jgi:hypothetical protein
MTQRGIVYARSYGRMIKRDSTYGALHMTLGITRDRSFSIDRPGSSRHISKYGLEHCPVVSKTPRTSNFAASKAWYFRPWSLA